MLFPMLFTSEHMGGDSPEKHTPPATEYFVIEELLPSEAIRVWSVVIVFGDFGRSDFWNDLQNC